MEHAAEKGHMNIVELLLEKGAKSYQWSMIFAGYGGYMDIVKLMLKNGADNYDMVMVNAAAGGHIDIVQLMLELGAKEYDYTIRTSDRNKDVINLVQIYKEAKTKII